MKKNKDLHETKKIRSLSPEEALRFLEDVRLMTGDRDEPTVSISIRVPGNVLRALKSKAKYEGKKYQSLMIELMRQGLRQR